VRRTPFRRLAIGPAPAADRIAYYNLWFRGHNNRRSEELLPRLERVDPYLYLCPDRQPLRGVMYRAWRASRPRSDRLVLGALAKRYRRLFSTDSEQVAFFEGDLVVDLDDPRFTERECELLSRPNVRAYVVTGEHAADLFRQAGVGTPVEIVPQGVDLATVTPEGIEAVATAHRRAGTLVVGYVSSWLLTGGDRGGERPTANVDHVLELWDEIHAAVPEAELWLIGNASRAVRALCAQRPSIRVLARIPPQVVLSYVATFDVALYPRTADHGPGIRALKIAEYVAVGAPTVAYDYEATALVRETGAGVLVQTPPEFVAATVALLRDPAKRAEMSSRGTAAGASFSWDVLSSRYAEILDRYLPPG
jgi:glycosyltransferase involved in cell wall biosynthesis